MKRSNSIFHWIWSKDCPRIKKILFANFIYNVINGEILISWKESQKTEVQFSAGGHLFPGLVHGHVED